MQRLIVQSCLHDDDGQGLTFSGCAPADAGFEDTSIVLLAEGLCRATQLRVLDIRNYPRLATAGVAALASTLCHLSRLEALDLSGMRAEAPGICLMEQYPAHVPPFPVLGVLDLNVDGASQLALGLSNAPMMRSLDLSCTQRRKVPSQ